MRRPLATWRGCLAGGWVRGNPPLPDDIPLAFQPLPCRGRMCHVTPLPVQASAARTTEQFGMRNFHLAGRSTVHAQNAMVATSHPLAALTAIEVLRSGGTAADAAVAACEIGRAHVW